MTNLANWAYGFVLNNGDAGVGAIYYAKAYFDRAGIVNPATAKPYTDEEIATIKNGATDGADSYISKLPEKAIIGMNVLDSDKIFWYDDENAQKIVASANPLLLNAETGEMKNTDGEIVAKSM